MNAGVAIQGGGPSSVNSTILEQATLHSGTPSHLGRVCAGNLHVVKPEGPRADECAVVVEGAGRCICRPASSHAQMCPLNSLTLQPTRVHAHCRLDC